MSFWEKLKSIFRKPVTSKPEKEGRYIETKNHGKLYFPIVGKFCVESHYATATERFADGLFPGTDSEKIQNHLLNSFDLLKKYIPDASFDDVYNANFKRVWTPANDGGKNEYGQAARGSLRPLPEEEIWQGNMFFKNLPTPGTKFLATANGRSCVIQMGYESGPGGTEFVGGFVPEVHYYLKTNNGSAIILTECSQTLPLGPLVSDGVHTTKPLTVLPDKKLWYPGSILPKRVMKPKISYANGYPLGAVIHFTAGRDKTEQDALDTHFWGCDEGYVFFVIGPTGKVYQSFPLDKGGSHAGESKWPGLGSSVSSKLVGIEIACAGELSSAGKSWFGVTYPRDEMRYVDESYGSSEGWYKRFTKEQEYALIDLLVWLKKNNPDVFNVEYILGHHEVSGKKGIGYQRKSDPGGSLSMTMDQLRQKISVLVK